MATDQFIIRDRMRQAILAFEAAESFFLNAHRRMENRLQADVDAYWAGLGQQVKEDMRIAAGEVEDASKAAAAAGLRIGAAGRIIARAQGYSKKPIKPKSRQREECA